MRRQTTAAVAIVVRDGNRRRACQNWHNVLSSRADRLRQFVGGMVENLFVEQAHLPVSKHIPGVQRHHIDAGMRVAWQEQDLIGTPALRSQALHHRGLELVRELQQVGGDQHELFVALRQHQCLDPNGIMNSSRRLALAVAVPTQGGLHFQRGRQVHPANPRQHRRGIRREGRGTARKHAGSQPTPN